MTLFRQRSLLQSQKLLRRERARLYRKIVFILILLVVLMWGLSAISFSPKLNVQTVNVVGNSAVSTQDVLNVAQDAFAGRKAFIFSGANILWYPKKQIEEILKYSFSWIDEVEIHRTNTTSIVIEIKERVPVVAWCGAKKGASATCRLVDSQGRVFADAPQTQGNAYIRLYGPLASADWQGAQFLTKTGLDHILAFIKGLPDMGLRPVEVEVVDSNIYDVYLDSGARISAQISDPVSSIVSNLSLLLGQKTFATSQASNFSDLLYIDTRFGNKLFYKFK